MSSDRREADIKARSSFAWDTTALFVRTLDKANAFVGSLTSQGDLLSQWRGYNRGQGFAVGLTRLGLSTVDLGSYDRVRYVGMLRTLGIVGSVEVPTSSSRAKAICELFEKDQRKFDQLAMPQAAKYISGADAVVEVVEIARKYWYAASRKSALAKDPNEKRSGKKLN
jgi:hypothetical protein